MCVCCVLLQVTLFISMRPTFGEALTKYGFSSSVNVVRKVTAKLVDIGSGSPMNPCQTSSSFAEVMILSFAKRGDRVLDLFAGVGSVALTCARLGINVTSLEHDPKQARTVASRLTDFPRVARTAFLKPVKLPLADLFPVASAPSSNASLSENPRGFTVLPYIPSGHYFSALSLNRYTALLVRTFWCVFVSTSFLIHTPPSPILGSSGNFPNIKCALSLCFCSTSPSYFMS